MKCCTRLLLGVVERCWRAVCAWLYLSLYVVVRLLLVVVGGRWSWVVVADCCWLVMVLVGWLWLLWLLWLVVVVGWLMFDGGCVRCCCMLVLVVVC